MPNHKESWNYRSDPMGRLNQGHYQNKDNPNMQLSVDEYQNRFGTQAWSDDYAKARGGNANMTVNQQEKCAP